MRVKHSEVRGDMAKLLSVSTPFLSVVENGKKNVYVRQFTKGGVIPMDNTC